MKHNPYTNKLSQINAPQEAVDKAVKAALEADKNRKEMKVMKKRNVIRLISAIAACAVLGAGIAVGNTLHPKTTPTAPNGESKTESVSHAFSLLVNAAEVKEEQKNALFDLDFGGMGSEAMGVMKKEGEQKLYAVWYPSIGFPVVCRGSGIASVTYKVNGALFEVNQKLHLLEESEEPGYTDPYFDSTPAYPFYSSFTVPYEEQLQCINVEESSDDFIEEEAADDSVAEEESIDDEVISGSVALIHLKPTSSPDLARNDAVREAQDFLANLEYFEELVDFRNNMTHPELLEALRDIYAEEIRNISVEITIHFQDGTDENYLLKLMPQEVQNSTDPLEMKVESVLTKQ